MPRTKVVIVGGPSGLILAIELGRRGVPCVLLEEDPTSPMLPKANATTSRTMEHYRRLGFAAALGARYEGQSREERDFMGGKMYAVYIKAPAFYEVVRAPRAWQYWAVNREQRALMNAIDGKELWVLHVQLPREGQAPADYARES